MRAAILPLLLFLLAPATLGVAISDYPIIPRELPSETSLLAVNDTTGDLIAYSSSGQYLGVVPPSNGTLVSRGKSNTCQALTKDDLKKRKPILCPNQTMSDTYRPIIVPGWQKLEDTAKKNWGKKSYNLVTNPDEVRYSPSAFQLGYLGIGF